MIYINEMYFYNKPGAYGDGKTVWVKSQCSSGGYSCKIDGTKNYITAFAPELKNMCDHCLRISYGTRRIQLRYGKKDNKWLWGSPEFVCDICRHNLLGNFRYYKSEGNDE